MGSLTSVVEAQPLTVALRLHRPYSTEDKTQILKAKATFDSQEHPKKLNAYKEKSEKGKKDKIGAKKEESTQANKQSHKSKQRLKTKLEKIQNQKHRGKCNITKEYCETKEIK